MSLIYWWPLTEDLTDKIQGKTFEKNDYWNIVEKGKIGKCTAPDYGTLNTGNSSVTKPTQMRVKNITIPETFSLAIWVKNNQIGNPFTFCPIQFSNGDPYLQGAANKGWDFSHNTWRLVYNDGAAFYGGRNSGSGSQSSWGTDLDTPLNEWYHIAFTVNRATNKTELFINGISKGVCDIPEGLGSFGGTYELRFNWVQGWLLNGAFNDLRIYNHILSKAEIQELKKALIVHYTCDDILAEPTINIMPSSYQKGQFITGASDNNYDSAGSFTVNTTAHGTYTLSGYYKIGATDTATNPRISLNVKYTEDSSAISLKQEWTILRDGEWHYFSLTGTTNSNKTLQHLSGWLFDYSNPGSGRICYAKDIQLELKDHATPYTASNRAGMFYNETGLTQPENNTIQNMQLVTDAAINTYSLKCNNTKILTPIAGDISQGATLSLWVNLPKDNSGKNIFPSSSEVVVADNNSQLAFGFFSGAHGIITCAGFKKSIMTNLKTALKDDWNYIAVIRDNNNNIKGYLNGIEYPLADSQEWTHSEPYFSIGCRYSGGWTSYYNGQVDNIRLYNTYLSPEEVKDLYNCGGRISNLGDALTSSFIEGTAATKVNKNHTITTNEIYEQILPDGYQQLEYIQSTGAQYINTGVIPTNQTEIQYDHQYIGSSSGWNALFGMDNHNTNAGMGFTVFIVDEEYRPYMGIDWGKNTGAYTSRKRELLILNQQGLSINDNKIYDQFTAGTHTALGDVKLFAYWRPANGTGSGSAVRLYKCKFLENKQVIRDFVPARRILDNILGLYDIINNQFYTNAGSGNFIAGPTITTGQASMLRAGGLTAREIIEI